jgi:hypothetical protein
MKKGDITYCINESVYSDHITKRKSYIITDIKPDQIRIANDRQKLVWLPNLCFVCSEIPDITFVKIDDEINDSQNECIEVTIEFSNGERRWATFMTLDWLNGLISKQKNYVTGNGLIILKEISETNIKQIIVELDKQNELNEMTRKY